MSAEANSAFPIQVEGMVGESENHQSEGVQAECGTDGSLAADRVLGKGVLDCSLSCGVLEVR